MGICLVLIWDFWSLVCLLDRDMWILSSISHLLYFLILASKLLLEVVICTCVLSKVFKDFSKLFIFIFLILHHWRQLCQSRICKRLTKWIHIMLILTKSHLWWCKCRALWSISILWHLLFRKERCLLRHVRWGLHSTLRTRRHWRDSSFWRSCLKISWQFMHMVHLKWLVCTSTEEQALKIVKLTH